MFRKVYGFQVGDLRWITNMFKFSSWKRTDILTDAAELESTVKSVILQHVQGATETNWKELPVNDSKTKFQVKSKCVQNIYKQGGF